MKVINLVLASGVGSRLYPLSTEEKPKQFLKLISKNMMLEDTINRFRPYSDESYIVTLEKYRRYVEDLENVAVVYEEERRESARSVLQGLSEIEKRNDAKNTLIIQSASDHYIDIDNNFDIAMNDALSEAEKQKIVIIGAKPRYVTSEYGYVKDGWRMIEKPSKEMARELIKNGHYWNTAIYVYPLSKMIDYFKAYYLGVGNSFEKEILNHIEFDLKVIESEMNWRDIGTREELERFEFDSWCGLAEGDKKING